MAEIILCDHPVKPRFRSGKRRHGFHAGFELGDLLERFAADQLELDIAAVLVGSVVAHGGLNVRIRDFDFHSDRVGERRGGKEQENQCGDSFHPTMLCKNESGGTASPCKTTWSTIPMQIWESITLGVVQGLTEFLPISSTAHLVVVREAMGHPHPDDAFTTVIQLGTLFAVFAYFRNDIMAMLAALVGDIRSRKLASTPASRMGWLIVLGSLPVGLIGLLFKSKIKKIFYDVPTMGIVAILFAILMLAAEVWHKIRTVDLNKPGVEENQITWKDAFWIGCWQMLAIMPGASRSGTTLTGAFFAGLTRPAAARFSFLLSLPSILAAGVKELYDEYKNYKNPKPEEAPSLFASGDELLTLGLATLVSGVVGYFAIAWLVGYLKKYNMGVFIVYRLVMGAALLIWWFNRTH